ncbi:MAG: MazG nucleotide pyrophosphohydrolase domain-containing protein [Gammaproteobacteria bacterium]
MQSIEKLLSIMAKLRDPDKGCPWDRIQDFKSIAPHTIEEAYEVADAIDQNNMDLLKDELGDLLFQVVYHSRLASELDQFRFEDVVDSITDKILRRHPHVFAGEQVDSARSQSRLWEQIKSGEKSGRSPSDSNQSVLTEEVGDLLFSCINLARHLGISAEGSLRFANRKFLDRFHYIEECLRKDGKDLNEASQEEMEILWQKAKHEQI